MLAHLLVRVFNIEMRENDKSSQDPSSIDVFAELTDTLREADDAGITVFEANLREIQEHLANEYIIPGTEVFHRELGDIDADIKEGWTHESDIATVSGRIYLYDDDAEDFVPKEWGEGLVDDDDDIYYIVDGAHLRSVAPELMTKFSNDGKLAGAKIAYMFAFPDDDDEMPVVFAYLGDLYEHKYEQPTPHEAATRLEKEWPEQFMFIQEWLHSDSKMPLTARLQFIMRELQIDLSRSEQFKKLLERYIQAFVTLDQALPYSVTTQEHVEYFDGDANPYVDDTKGEWLPLKIEGQLSFLGYYPKIEIKKKDDGDVRCLIIVSTFNNEDGDVAERIRIDVNTTSGFISTRAMGSILSRATSGEERRAALDAVAPSGDFELSVIDSRDEAGIEFDHSAMIEKESSKEDDPQRIKDMIRLEETITAAIRLIQSRLPIFYDTGEEAQEAARELVSTEITKLFKDVKISPDFDIVVSGYGIVVPNGKADFISHDSPGDRQGFIYTFPKGEPVTRVEPGEFYTGHLVTLIPAMGVIEGEDGEAERYRIKPAFAINVTTENFYPVSVNNVGLIDITVNKKILAPLDGSVDFKIAPLETYREALRVFDRLEEKNGLSVALALSRKLHRSLVEDANDNTYTVFKETELFEQLELFGLRDEAHHLSDRRDTVELLETILVGTKITVKGDLLGKNDEGEYESIEREDDESVQGKVIDIRTDIEGDEIFLAIDPGMGVIAYIRLRSITQFMF